MFGNGLLNLSSLWHKSVGDIQKGTFLDIPTQNV